MAKKRLTKEEAMSIYQRGRVMYFVAEGQRRKAKGFLGLGKLSKKRRATAKMSRQVKMVASVRGGAALRAACPSGKMLNPHTQKCIAQGTLIKSTPRKALRKAGRINKSIVRAARKGKLSVRKRK